MNDLPQEPTDRERPDTERPDTEPTLNLGEPRDVEHTLNLGETVPPAPSVPPAPLAPPTHPPTSAYPVQNQAPNPNQPYAGAPSAYPTAPPQGYPFGYPLTTPQPAEKPAKARLSGWVWPAISALALVLGVAGGALGAVAVDQWGDDGGPGRTSGGLADVETVSKPPLPADNGSIAAVAENVLPSTVQILADLDDEELGATGSGFVLDEEGHVVTNNHVIEGAAPEGKIKVVDQSGKRYDATIVGRSPIYDLAVLFVKDFEDAKPASLGTSVDLRIGEGVVAIGSPLGLSSTVTSGIVSALNRPVSTKGDTKDFTSYINAVQTDAAINPGNSGGPLVDLQGRVVGVNSAIATTGGGLDGEAGNIGVGFAIPIEQVRITADEILRDGEATYPIIGATVNSDGTGDGAHIEEVDGDSPSAKAGLKKGDVVTALDGRPVHDSPSLIVAIRSHVPGDEVTLTVRRGGKEQKLKVVLGGKTG